MTPKRLKLNDCRIVNFCITDGKKLLIIFKQSRQSDSHSPSAFFYSIQNTILQFQIYSIILLGLETKNSWDRTSYFLCVTHFNGNNSMVCMSEEKMWKKHFTTFPISGEEISSLRLYTSMLLRLTSRAT